MLHEQLLPFARFVVFNGSSEELRAQCEFKKRPPQCAKPLTDASQEQVALRFVNDAIANLLRLYPTSLEDDECLLRELPPHSPERSYIRLRRDEKRCLGVLQRQVGLPVEGIPPLAVPEGASNSLDSVGLAEL